MNIYGFAGGDEENPIYKKLETENGQRQYGYLASIIESAVATNQVVLGHDLVQSFNYLAVVGLHPEAGRYREVPVFVADFTPPDAEHVPSMMDDFFADVNGALGSSSPTVVAAYALWRINFIHPFVNGNGRTARATAYFILCTQFGGVLPGHEILPEMLRVRYRNPYVEALKAGDAGNLQPLIRLVGDLMTQQVTGYQ